MSYVYSNHERIDTTVSPYEKEYITNPNDTNSYKFNKDLFNKLISERRYTEAVEYGRKFKRLDPIENESYTRSLYGMEHQGRILSSIYGKLKDEPNELNKLEFVENVYTGGLDDLITKDNPNIYAEQFLKLKSNIGNKATSELINGKAISSDISAQKISVTFKPKKQYGIFGWDSWAADNNDYCIERFYEDSGFDAQSLQQYGVEVSLKDGDTTITFDKNNPIANRIFLNLPIDPNVGKVNPRTGQHYNPYFQPKIQGIDENGNTLDIANFVNAKDIKAMQDLYKEAKQTKDRVLSVLGGQEESYKSFSIPVIAAGATDDDVKIIDNYVRGIASSAGPIFSNHGNKPGDETLTYMEDEDRQKVLTAIKAANPNDLTFYYMSAGGKTGLRVVIKPNSITDKQAQEMSKDVIDASNNYNGNSIDVFIPGLFTRQAENAVNGNTSLSAAREINDMKKYKYEYPLYNGANIIYSVDLEGNASFIDVDTKQPISDDKAEELINKTLIVQQGESLKYQYINKYNTVFDSNGFDEHAKLYAISAAIDLNPGYFTHTINEKGEDIFTDIYGKKYTIKDFFDKKGAGDMVSEIAGRNMNAFLFKFHQDIFDVYGKLQQDIKNYK